MAAATRSGTDFFSKPQARALTNLAYLTVGALPLGGNAVIGVDLDYEVLGQNGSMLMVSASGTAVRL